LPAEVAYDAAYQATCTDGEIAALQANVSKRAIAVAGLQVRNGSKSNFALTVFGRSTRESNCDCDRSTEASLLQTVYLKNDEEVLSSISRRGGWVDQMLNPRQSGRGQSGKGQSGKGQDKAARPGKGEQADDTPADIAARMEGLQRIIEKLKASGDEKKAKKAEARLAGLIKRFGNPADNAATDAQPAAAGENGVTPAAGAAPVLPFQPADAVREAYLRTLSRLPTAAEAERSTRFIQDATDGAEALNGLLWALLNTKEFIVNH